MAAERNRRRTGKRLAHPYLSVPQEPTGKNKGVLAAQTALCSVLLLALMAGWAFDLSWYGQSRDYLLARMNEPDQTEQVQAVLSQVTGWQIPQQSSDPMPKEPVQESSTEEKLQQLEEYIRQYGGRADPSQKGQGGPLPVRVSEETAVPANCLLSPVSVSKRPCLPLAAASVTSLYGFRQHPISGEGDFHTGIDLAAPQGTRVACAWSGRVAETGWSNGYGNYVLVSHSGGLATFYAHLSSVSVKTGEVLRQGEQIGTVGSTGVSTGPHRHWEIRIGEKRADPAWVLQPFLVRKSLDEA